MLNVQKHLLDGNTVDSLTDSHGIRVYRHPELPLVGLKYSQIDSSKYDPIVRECRGLVLEDKTWKVVAKPFHRFYNVGEDVDAFKAFNWDDFDCTTKEDGSLILLFHYEGDWHVNTSGSFGYGDVGFSGKSWRDLFWQTSGIRPWRLGKSLTYIFELCSTHNKVVRIYPKPTVYLLGATRPSGCAELGPLDVDIEAAIIGCPRPERHRFKSMAEITAFLEAKAETDMTFEGVVLRDSNGVRFKAKSKSYVALHHLHDNGNIFNPKRLVPLVLAGDRDEVVAYFPEVTEAIDKVAAEIEQAWLEVLNLWWATWRIESQKEFALRVVGATPYSGLLFTLRKRHGMDQTADLLAALWRESGDTIIKHLCGKEVAA